MKTWKKWMAGMLCAASAVWIGVTAHTMAASAECSDPDVCAVYDDAVVLTAEEEQELDDRIRETAEKIDMNVAVFLSGTRVDRADTRDTAADYYIELFGKKSDGVFYYMDLSGDGDTSYAPYDYIYTRGWAQFYYTNSESNNRVDEIFSALDPYLERGQEDPYEAVLAFCNELEYYYGEGIPDHYYVRQTDKEGTDEEYMYVQDGEIVYAAKPPFRADIWVPLSILAGVLVACFTFFAVKKRYRFKFPSPGTHYVDREKVHFLQQSDVFLRQYQTRTKIVHESSSGGGGGGGGGGSSHHHTSSSRGQGGRAGAFQALLLTGTFVILGSAGTITYLHRAKKKQAAAREKLKEFSIGEDHWDRSEIQERVRESYYRIQECWRDRDLEKGHPYLSQKMQQEFQTKFEWSRMRHEVFVMEGIQLLDAILVEAENEDGDDRDYIWYLIHGKMIDYVYHEETGELLKGSRKMEDFFEYWRFVLEDGNWVLDEICQKEEVDNGRKLC